MQKHMTPNWEVTWEVSTASQEISRCLGSLIQSNIIEQFIMWLLLFDNSLSLLPSPLFLVHLISNSNNSRVMLQSHRPFLPNRHWEILKDRFHLKFITFPYFILFLKNRDSIIQGKLIQVQNKHLKENSKK